MGEVKRTDTCETCVFFDDTGDRMDGLCRAHAPSPSKYRAGDKDGRQEECGYEHFVIWPTVTSTDWCGEHKRK